MRPSSLGGGRILRRTLFVCLSVCLSVRLSVRLTVCLSVRPVIVYIRTVLRANIQNRKASVFAYGPASRRPMYFSARAEGRISYGHLGRTNLLCMQIIDFNVYLVTLRYITDNCTMGRQVRYVSGSTVVNSNRIRSRTDTC